MILCFYAFATSILCTSLNIMLLHLHMYLSLVQGIDYVGQTANLSFALGDSQICHTVDIINNNNKCESTTEDFFADLVYVSGININIVQDTTRVLVDDSNEPGCSELNS